MIVIKIAVYQILLLNIHRKIMILLIFILAETIVELRKNLKLGIETLTSISASLMTSISSGCELFLRFITLTALDNPVCTILRVTLLNLTSILLNFNNFNLTLITFYLVLNFIVYVKDFTECKNILLQRGKLFLKKVASCRSKISKLAIPFIHDGAVSNPQDLKNIYN